MNRQTAQKKPLSKMFIAIFVENVVLHYCVSGLNKVVFVRRTIFMTISAALEAKILRYYHVEKWRIGTIANQLSVHHSVVRRVLSQAGIPSAQLTPKKSILDPFLPFVLETLIKYPTLTSRRLHAMVCERGYSGGPDHFRHLMVLHRPRPLAEAYLRLRTLPGEQAQVDWGHFGHIIVGKAKRPLMAFVMVLSFSRKIFLRFYLNCQMANFLRGHEAAFGVFQGVPRVLLYDNLKSAVLERQGDAIRFHPTLLEFSAHYRFEPRPVAIARGNEKGRVERSIRYIRDNFFAARKWKDLDDLNNQAEHWCNEQAANRPCPEDRQITVRNVFEQEKPKLMALPDNPFPTEERVAVRVGKTPYVRFDLNDYSVPHIYVHRVLTVLAKIDKVFILNSSGIIAKHPRSYDKAKQIEDDSHIKMLAARKKEARQHRGQNRLTHAAPASTDFLIRAAERSYNLGSITSALLQLLDRYGAAELEIAIIDALERDVPHPNAVRLNLERRREKRNQLPPVTLDLPNDKRVRELIVRPHKLYDYDQLQSLMEEKDHGN
jgi:transposase